jgi:hypothetical protein
MPLTLSGTNGISGVDGSNTTPAVRGGTSSSNGVFYGTNTVSIATNSTTAVTVDSSGNLKMAASTYAIGTAIPGGTGANCWWVDGQGGSTSSTRFRSLGPDASTNGGYTFTSARSDNSNISSPMTLDSSGNLLVGTTSTSSRLTVNGAGTGAGGTFIARNSSSSTVFYLRDDGVVQSGTLSLSPYNFGAGATNKALYVDNSGYFGYLTSVREAKTNITTLANANFIYSLNPVTFNYRTRDENRQFTNQADPRVQYGLIADELEQVCPDLCEYGADGKLTGIDYRGLIIPVIKAIQELSAKNDALEARIAALEAK